MTTITLSGISTDFKTYFKEPIEFDSGEAALLSLETYNSIPNITEINNKFKYSNDGGITWKIIILPPDAYEYRQIADEIKMQMIKNNDVGEDIYFINFDIRRLSSVIEINHKDYKIDFGCENSIGPTLGFTDQIIGEGIHKSPNIVNISHINTILVNVDFISHSYLNEDKYPILYKFYPKVAPGYKIVQTPQNLIYLPVNRNPLNEIRLWLTDQDRKPLDLQGEKLTVTIHIREKK